MHGERLISSERSIVSALMLKYRRFGPLMEETNGRALPLSFVPNSSLRAQLRSKIIIEVANSTALDNYSDGLSKFKEAQRQLSRKNLAANF